MKKGKRRATDGNAAENQPRKQAKMPTSASAGNSGTPMSSRDGCTTTAQHPASQTPTPAAGTYTNPIDLTNTLNHSRARPSPVREPQGSRSFDSAFSHSDSADFVFKPSAYKQHLDTMRCGYCQEPSPLRWEDVAAHTASCLNGNFLHPFVRCKRCNFTSCAGGGCRQQHNFSRLESQYKHQGLGINTCCAEGWLFLVFSITCGPVTASTPLKRDHVKAATEPDVTGKQDRKSTSLFHKMRHSYSHLSKGTGYGTDYDMDDWAAAATMGKLRVAPAAVSADENLEKYFFAVTGLLSIFTRQGYNIDCPFAQPALVFMLTRSPLLRKASDLLRQDSIEDLGTQKALYSALIDLLESIMGHDQLASQLIYQQQMRHPVSDQLIAITFGSGDSASNSQRNGSVGRRAKDSSAGVSSKADKTQSIDASMQKLSIHCSYYVRAASNHMDLLQSEREEQNMLRLATRVVKIAQKLDSGRKSALAFLSEKEDFGPAERGAPGPNVTTRSQAAKASEKTKAEELSLALWHRENCVDAVPDELLLESLVAKKVVKAADKSTTSPGRMKAIIKQIASLCSDLPNGIFVRHGTSRPDIMRVLIVGPEDTPYNRGLFEFDLACPQTFPQTPPVMHFRTTGNGRVRFNPNLYADGKVCLSLLGTWSGPGWFPNQSTILQILISIQAMIFNSQPYYNEPGYERSKRDDKSRSYNSATWINTVRHAVLYWLDCRLAPPKGTTSRAAKYFESTAKSSSSALTSFHAHPDWDDPYLEEDDDFEPDHHPYDFLGVPEYQQQLQQAKLDALNQAAAMGVDPPGVLKSTNPASQSMPNPMMPQPPQPPQPMSSLVQKFKKATGTLTTSHVPAADKDVTPNMPELPTDLGLYYGLHFHVGSGVSPSQLGSPHMFYPYVDPSGMPIYHLPMSGHSPPQTTPTPGLPSTHISPTTPLPFLHIQGASGHHISHISSTPPALPSSQIPSKPIATSPLKHLVSFGMPNMKVGSEPTDAKAAIKEAKAAKKDAKNKKPETGPPVVVTDDAIWGEVLRKYFSANANAIIRDIKLSPYGKTQWDTELENRLREFGFAERTD